MGYLDRPWRPFQGKGSPEHMTFDNRTLYQAVSEIAEKHPRSPAYDYLGRVADYQSLRLSIDETAAAFEALGVRQGDVMTICLPNCPQALFAFYALNKLGAVASMIHPLSVTEEVRVFLDISSSKWFLTLDAFWSRVAPALEGSKVVKAITCRIQRYMPPIVKAGFMITKGRKIKKIPPAKNVLSWAEMIRRTPSGSVSKEPQRDVKAMSVILYSGGTTGTPKGIMLSDWNFNALTQGLNWQIEGGVGPGDKVLSILPLFHGFGLGVTANAFLTLGGTSILVPQFSADAVIKVLLRKKPQFIAGVPTLFEALSLHPDIKKVDFSPMKGVFGGGDKVPETVKKRFDEIMQQGGGTVELLEGYGLTETVTACSIMPPAQYRKDSVGIPMPGIEAKIIRSGTTDEVPYGDEGELCISGPTNMLGYLNQKQETLETLKTHGDGRQWIHTGDLCSMDSDGFIYFKMRLKRMVKVSGIAVYPPQVEEILRQHDAIRDCCVIGVPDPYKMYVIKAFVVLVDPEACGEDLAKNILEWASDKLNKWSLPKDLEFRDELPLTRVGKIAYTELEKEAREAAEAS